MQLGQSVLGRQPLGLLLGTELLEFEAGRAVLAIAVRDELLQQHGFVHGGVVSYLIDNAITFAGGSVLGENVVTAEFKVNYLQPALGQRLVATAVVESTGRRLAVCRCEVVSFGIDGAVRCAVGLGTIAALG
jgi:uncharacterized protein (TIGR00369 family)